MKTIKTWNNGRVGIWLACNRNRIRTWAAGILLLVLIAITGGMDYQDQLNEAQARAERAEQRAKDYEIASKLPRTVFVLEGKTVREVQNKLSQVAGDMDGENYRLRLAK